MRSPFASGRFAILADSDVRGTKRANRHSNQDCERNVPCEVAHSGISPGGVVAAMDLEDTQNVVGNNSLTAALECDLAAHVHPEVRGTQCAVAGEDFPRASRRLRLIWNEDVDPHVRAAQALIEKLVHRVGLVAAGTVLPWAIRQQRWSPMNVPLMWSAAGDGPVHRLIG